MIKLVYGDLIGTFTPMVRGGWKQASNTTVQLSRWIAVYFLCSNGKTLASLRANITTEGGPLQQPNHSVSLRWNVIATISRPTAWRWEEGARNSMLKSTFGFCELLKKWCASQYRLISVASTKIRNNHIPYEKVHFLGWAES